MRPYTAAFIYASTFSGAVALFAALEGIDRLQRGFQLADSFLLEVLATVGFYFVLVFVLVAKFPSWPTRCLLALRGIFSLSSLRSPVQRLFFIVLCAGLLVIAIASVTYYLNGHDGLIEYWFGDRRWASSSFRFWLWSGLLATVSGLFGSFLHNVAIKPVVRWVKGEPASGQDKSRK